jgi:hypothetical protein
LQVLPDAEAIWNAVLDPRVSAEYVRVIQVKSPPETFNPPASGQDPQIQRILVDFERGNTVELTPTALEMEVRVHIPLTDYILGHLDMGGYRYRTQLIGGGKPMEIGDWQNSSVGILYVGVS